MLSFLSKFLGHISFHICICNFGWFCFVSAILVGFVFADCRLIYTLGLHMPRWPMKVLVENTGQFLQSQKVVHVHQTVRRQIVQVVGTTITVWSHMEEVAAQAGVAAMPIVHSAVATAATQHF